MQRRTINFLVYPLLVSVISVLLTACGYQLGKGELQDCYSTISIPYAKGDLTGALTAEVIKEMNLSGVLDYVVDNGDLELEIKIGELSDENIGFRYDRKMNGHLKKALIPTEERVEMTAEVSLYDRRTEQRIRGPILIRAAVDFDHTFYASRDQENIYSLGQLSDIDAAREEVMIPLNKALAVKIVDYIINSW